MGTWWKELEDWLDTQDVGNTEISLTSTTAEPAGAMTTGAENYAQYQVQVEGQASKEHRVNFMVIGRGTTPAQAAQAVRVQVAAWLA